MRHLTIKSLKTARFLCGSGLLAVLAACGDGGTAVSTLTIKGTAATGLALDNAAVSVSCVSGTGTATTTANGSYTLVVNGSGPCIITVTKGDVSLSSFSTGTGNSTVNVTPLTNAAVQYFQKITGAITPAAMLTTPAAVALLSDPVAVQKRITEDFVPFVQTTLGVAITGTDFLTAVIVPPATVGGVGNAADHDLELFKAVTTDTGVLPSVALVQLQDKASADVANKPLPVVLSTPITGAGS